jgi:hypothetical protein
MTRRREARWPARHAVAAIVLLLACCLSPASAVATEADETTAVAVRVATPPTTESLELARQSAPVRKLMTLYAEAGATTSQLAQLESLDAEAYAMRNDATAQDLARFRRQRERILEEEQLRRVRERLRREFAETLRTPRPAATPGLDTQTTGPE